jgi:hypothetical protein
MVAAAVVLLASQTILVFVPWRSTDKYHRYFNTGPLVREAIESGSWPPGVYLIEGANQPDYAAAMIYGSPALGTGEHVFAYDSLANSAARLREAYPDRRLFRVQGPSITGDVYRVRANRPTGP